MKNTWVISLGGSRIVPDDVDWKFLSEFKALLDRHRDKNFAVVCGGGRTARRYMSALKKLGKKTRGQSIEGIAVTRFHAFFMARLFGRSANEEIPRNMKRVKNLLLKNQVVFSGALRWEPNNTSDGTAAKLAGYLNCPFINLTNVDGLYTMDPRKNKKAKLVRKISWKGFWDVAKKIKFEAGQHFVLDKVAALEIMEDKTRTFIVGSLKEMDRVLDEEKFLGTEIFG